MCDAGEFDVERPVAQSSGTDGEPRAPPGALSLTLVRDAEHPEHFVVP
jgi:hypothetical protein